MNQTSTSNNNQSEEGHIQIKPTFKTPKPIELPLYEKNTYRCSIDPIYR